MLLLPHLIILDYSRHSLLTLRGKKRRCACPLIFEAVFLNPLSFHVDNGWCHHCCCTVPAVQVPEMAENHPPSCLGSWSPPEPHRAGGISPSPPGALSGWRPVPAVPQADWSPVWGPVSSGRCQDLPYSTGCPHTATISFSSIVAQSDPKQPYVREVTSLAWTRWWLDVEAQCGLKSWIFSTLFTSLQTLQTLHLRRTRRSICVATVWIVSYRTIYIDFQCRVAAPFASIAFGHNAPLLDWAESVSIVSSGVVSMLSSPGAFISTDFSSHLLSFSDVNVRWYIS